MWLIVAYHARLPKLFSLHEADDDILVRYLVRFTVGFRH